MLDEPAHPAHAYNPLVQIGEPTLAPKSGD
jgi:hypothetical protein